MVLFRFPTLPARRILMSSSLEGWQRTICSSIFIVHHYPFDRKWFHAVQDQASIILFGVVIKFPIGCRTLRINHPRCLLASNIESYRTSSEAVYVSLSIVFSRFRELHHYWEIPSNTFSETCWEITCKTDLSNYMYAPTNINSFLGYVEVILHQVPESTAPATCTQFPPHKTREVKKRVISSIQSPAP